MAEFIFVAKDAKGENVRGEIESRKRDLALRRLQESGLTVLSFEEVRPRHWIWTFIQPVRKDVVVLFIRQLAVMLGSGVPLMKGLHSLVPTQPGMLQKSLQRVYVGVSSGYSLSQALRRSPQVFSPFFIGAVRVGEASGRLPETLERCASWLEMEHAYGLRLRAALVYPCVLLGACALLVAFIFTFMVPRFVGLFVDLRMELPTATRILLEASHWVEQYWLVVLLTAMGPMLVLAVLFLQWARTPVGRAGVERWSLRIPLYGKQIRYRMMSQFLRSTATLLASGIPLGSSLAVLEKSLDRQLLVLTAQLQTQAVMDGLPLAYGMQQSGLFPPMVLELMAVGQETGKLPEMLERLASFYDQEMALGLATLSKLIEPMVVLILGGVVAFLLLAAFLPIYQLAASF